jgi:thiamine biosynthesis lipoprotein
MEPVIGLWGIGTDEARIPEENELEEALSYVDYQKIQLDEAEQTVYLEEGMAIDLGAIAKGYAADQVAAYLKDQGITKSIINLGGNVMLIGQKDEDTLFKVGLQDPYDVRNKYFGIIEEADKTIVTSGVYERNFEEDGVLYHHILSPEDGYPVRNNIGAVSVVAETSIDADALSTVLFAVGKEKGLELVETLEGVECIYIMENHEIFTSSGIDENALTLINTDYSFSK